MKAITESQFKSLIRDLLEERNFVVTDIPESSTGRTADFHISDLSCSALIELKIKSDSTEELIERTEVLRAGEVYLRSESSLRRNTLSGLVSDGVAQMVATQGYPHQFKILWLHCTGLNPDHTNDRFHATLYGARNIIHVEKNISGAMWCYYFDNSDFFRHRDALDAAIISNGEGVMLCINDLSTRAELLRNSSLGAAFRDGYCDPEQFKKEGSAYRLTESFDRSNPTNALYKITEKYNCGRVIDLDMAQHSAEIVIL